MDDFNSDKTKFNSGIAQLERIDRQMQILQMARIQHHWDAMTDALINIRSEIDGSMTPEEKTEGDTFEFDIKKLLFKVRRKGSDLRLITEYERFLGQIQKKYGYSMPLKDDPRWAASG